MTVHGWGGLTAHGLNRQTWSKRASGNPGEPTLTMPKCASVNPLEWIHTGADAPAIPACRSSCDTNAPGDRLRASSGRALKGSRTPDMNTSRCWQSVVINGGIDDFLGDVTKLAVGAL